jgi:uncharacterized protein (DUF1778 family)
MEAGTMGREKATSRTERSRDARLDFRVDARTKALVQRAARLERRNLTDFCVTALAEAARDAIARHESVELSAADRVAFFDALVHPPQPSPRLRRAFEAERRTVER